MPATSEQQEARRLCKRRFYHRNRKRFCSVEYRAYKRSLPSYRAQLKKVPMTAVEQAAHTAAKERASWDARLQKTYGISVEQYEAMLVEQNGVCAICGQENASGQRLSTDHSHVTGKVRGLLCHGCNQALGKFKDNEELLLRAVAYLRK